MIPWWWLIIAASAGGMIGMGVACLCSASKRADEEMERFAERFNRERGGTF